MPFYQIYHSHPLSTDQKTQLAQKVTHLHSRTFTTPSIFVNVTFTPVDGAEQQTRNSHDEATSSANYFVGGRPRSQTLGSNRIFGLVRTSEKRTKADWDALAEKIEEAWYEVVVGDGEDRQGKGKELIMVSFYPMLAVREKGMVVPEAGKESQWLKSHISTFQRRAAEGDEEFTDLLEEIQTRDDLKAWRD